MFRATYGISWQYLSGENIMHFKVKHLGASGNLLLTSKENKPVATRMQLYYNDRRVGEVFETIGRIDSPLYLARIKENAAYYVGKELIGR